MRNLDAELYAEFVLERRENASVKSAGGFAPDAPGGGRTRFGRDGSRGKKYTITKKGVALLLVLSLLSFGSLGAGGALLASTLSGDKPVRSHWLGAHPDLPRALDPMLGVSAAGNTLEQATGSKLSIQEIISLTADAVVEISTEQVATDLWINHYVTRGAGSGVIVSPNGYIITNHHVIEDAHSVTVILKNGNRYAAEVVGADAHTDVAVVKIDEYNLTAATFGDSDSLLVGDLAVAIGNPLGELGGTVTAGVISALDRQLSIEGGRKMTLLQTDASINPGNSGGGLFDQYGQLIGIVVAKSANSNAEGLGFAIPINLAKDAAAQIVDYGYVRGRVDVGLTFVDLTSTQNAIFYGVPYPGIYVKSVDSNNAIGAGFQVGDMIFAVSDAIIEDAGDLTKALQQYQVGDTVAFTVVRDSKTLELTLRLGEKRD